MAILWWSPFVNRAGGYHRPSYHVGGGLLVVGRVMPIRVDGVDLLVEASPVAGSEPTSALDRAQDTVAEAFDRAQSAIVAVAGSTVDVIRRMGARSVEPDQVEVKFGLKFSVQGNVILAAAAGEASLEVTLTYHADPARRGERGGTGDGA
jgi:NTP-dependent ternary system trypsin peptidase co-occuring protein